MLNTIAIAFTVVVACVLIYAATRPDSFSISRSVSIAAAPDKIFPLINNLHGFNRWNPFLEPDPAIKIAYRGPDSGKGAAHDWDGNSQVGKGSVEITESSPPSKIVMKLDMLKPMKAHNRVEFKLEPAGNGTQVTWTMSGEQPFLAKLMSVVIDCDKMVGGSFEKGLAGLKAIAEKQVLTSATP